MILWDWLIVLLLIYLTEGEIQGTVHRRLLEDRVEELKVGAVLLLKQVRLPASLSSNFNDGNRSSVF